MELRPYQRQSVDAIYTYFENNKVGNGLVVAPTASGKSVIIGKFIEETLKLWPSTRILMLAHRKELLQQNASKIFSMWPEVSLGFYSAGLKVKQLGRSVTVAGIQSVSRKAKDLGWIDLILVDECHLLPPDGEGTYRTLIKGLMEINPKLRIVGFTATPYRLKSGLLIGEQTLFTDIIHDISIRELLEQGYLCPLVSKSAVTQADLSSVGKRGGEYIQGEAELVFNKEALTRAALDEVEKYCGDRKSWIVFCSGVDHAKNVCAALNERGHTAEVVVGDTEDMFRQNTINKFKTGQIKALVNCDVLTTGFDAPNIDAIIMLRATQSTGLYVQILGRGMRLHSDKKDCLVLDFGGNLERHGPIDEIKVRAKKAKDKDAVNKEPVKICPECRTANKIAVLECSECGFVFPITERAVKHDTVASDASPLALRNPLQKDPPQRYEVDSVTYNKHPGKDGKPPTLRVNYDARSGEGNLQRKKVSEWICFEHANMRGRVATWWLQHLKEDNDNITTPVSVDGALARINDLKKPKAIWVQKDGQWDRIISREFPTVTEEEAVEEAKRELEDWVQEVGL